MADLPRVDADRSFCDGRDARLRALVCGQTSGGTAEPVPATALGKDGGRKTRDLGRPATPTSPPDDGYPFRNIRLCVNRCCENFRENFPHPRRTQVVIPPTRWRHRASE